MPIWSGIPNVKHHHFLDSPASKSSEPEAQASVRAANGVRRPSPRRADPRRGVLANIRTRPLAGRWLDRDARRERLAGTSRAAGTPRAQMRPAGLAEKQVRRSVV